jgi:RNA polymerase sigma-70 factor (ECF subfamily)
MESPSDLDRLSLIVRTRRAGLAALARSEGATPEDAVDCVQDALYTWLETASRGEVPVDVDEGAAMLAVMVRNAARNRRRRHFRAAPHDDIDAHALAAGVPEADELIARAEEHVRLRACVEELCEIQRSVVMLRMLEERPGEDVARALGISAGHVAVLLHRAKAALRACMVSG